MNKRFAKEIAKAGAITCLFLCALANDAVAQQWQFDETSQRAYAQVLNLQLTEARQLLPDPKTSAELYVASLADALELLITEDGELYQQYHEVYQDRLDKKSKGTDRDDLFLHAELRLQWCFVYLKFGHEFDAAYNLRQAYLVVQECKRKYPDYEAIKKTSGLIEIIVGSVPEKYNWVLHLLGMQGSINDGLTELKSVWENNSANNPFVFEAGLLYALVNGFVLQQTSAAFTDVKSIVDTTPTNRLALFLGGALALKNSSSEEALKMFLALEAQPIGLPIYYAYYLKGEVYLHKADYLNAISAYRWFINHNMGQNYIKDAHYKIGLCYWLNGNVSDAHVVFKDAKGLGKESTEADKYAARSMADPELPNVPLTKARFYTDGGYYDNARQILDSITPADLPTQRDKTEFYYRKARLLHKTNQNAAAKLFYQQTVDANGAQPWYFAPNSCLQLGYILLQEKNEKDARAQFEKALSYKRHEYKNSIDAKAKTALAQLNKRK